MDKIETIVQRLPHFYAAYNDKSKMYGLLKAFADEFDIVVNDYINRSDNDIGVMTTDARDLEWRWGSLIGFPRLGNESYERYRMRLVNMVNALRGGTAPAIRYAVALMLGIADDTTETEQKIKVYDAWEYDNTPQGYDAYGNFVVVIKINGEDFDIHYYDGIEDDIDDIIKVVKAAGTNCVVLIGNTVYSDMGPYHYHQFWTLTHDDIRKRLNEIDITHVDIDGFYDSNAREILDCDGTKFIEGQDIPDVVVTELFDRYNVGLFDIDGIGLSFSRIIEKVFDGLRDRFGGELHDFDGVNLYESEDIIDGDIH